MLERCVQRTVAAPIFFDWFYTLLQGDYRSSKLSSAAQTRPFTITRKTETGDRKDHVDSSVNFRMFVLDDLCTADGNGELRLKRTF